MVCLCDVFNLRVADSCKKTIRKEMDYLRHDDNTDSRVLYEGVAKFYEA